MKETKMYCAGCGKRISEGEELFPKSVFPRNYIYAEKFCGECNKARKAYDGAVPKFCHLCGAFLQRNPFDGFPEEHRCIEEPESEPEDRARLDNEWPSGSYQAEPGGPTFCY